MKNGAPTVAGEEENADFVLVALLLAGIDDPEVTLYSDYSLQYRGANLTVQFFAYDKDEKGNLKGRRLNATEQQNIYGAYQRNLFQVLVTARAKPYTLDFGDSKPAASPVGYTNVPIAALVTSANVNEVGTGTLVSDFPKALLAQHLLNKKSWKLFLDPSDLSRKPMTIVPRTTALTITEAASLGALVPPIGKLASTSSVLLVPVPKANTNKIALGEATPAHYFLVLATNDDPSGRGLKAPSFLLSLGTEAAIAKEREALKASASLIFDEHFEKHPYRLSITEETPTNNKTIAERTLYAVRHRLGGNAFFVLAKAAAVEEAPAPVTLSRYIVDSAKGTTLVQTSAPSFIKRVIAPVVRAAGKSGDGLQCLVPEDSKEKLATACQQSGKKVVLVGTFLDKNAAAKSDDKKQKDQTKDETETPEAPRPVKFWLTESDGFSLLRVELMPLETSAK